MAGMPLRRARRNPANIQDALRATRVHEANEWALADDGFAYAALRGTPVGFPTEKLAHKASFGRHDRTVKVKIGKLWFIRAPAFWAHR